jgi:hypothetical protein
MVDRTSSSIAVMQALSSLSALFLYGPQRAKQVRRQAIIALAESSRFALTDQQKLQHIAAHLLLTRYEVR